MDKLKYTGTLVGIQSNIRQSFFFYVACIQLVHLQTNSDSIRLVCFQLYLQPCTAHA